MTIKFESSSRPNIEISIPVVTRDPSTSVTKIDKFTEPSQSSTEINMPTQENLETTFSVQTELHHSPIFEIEDMSTNSPTSSSIAETYTLPVVETTNSPSTSDVSINLTESSELSTPIQETSKSPISENGFIASSYSNEIFAIRPSEQNSITDEQTTLPASEYMSEEDSTDQPQTEILEENDAYIDTSTETDYVYEYDEYYSDDEQYPENSRN